MFQEATLGLNVLISILQHVSHITTCKFLGLGRKHIAYLVLLLRSYISWPNVQNFLKLMKNKSFKIFYQ